MGPFLYLWYSVMNEYGPEDDLRGSLLKCLFEQFTLEPFCIAMYIVYDGVVCRRGFRPTVRKLATDVWPLWIKNAIFWLPANFANYYIGTPDMRVLFANLCSLFWNIYFSIKINALRIAAANAATAGHTASTLPLFSKASPNQTTASSPQSRPRDRQQQQQKQQQPPPLQQQQQKHHQQKQVLLEHDSWLPPQPPPLVPPLSQAAQQHHQWRSPPHQQEQQQEQQLPDPPPASSGRFTSSAARQRSAAQQSAPGGPTPSLPPYEKSPPNAPVSSDYEYPVNRVMAL
jgi:hypothetical protein